MSSEEARLVNRCLRGESAAVRELVERFQTDVYGLCVRLLGDRHEAEDASQEVFLRVFRSLKRWDVSRPFKPWIMGIAVNRCRTYMAKRARRPELANYLHETAIGRPEDDSRELVRELRLAVQTLRPEYRTAFVMFHEQGLPYDEIAEALDCPVGTVKTWLYRARTEVFDRLRSRGMVPEPSDARNQVS